MTAEGGWSYLQGYNMLLSSPATMRRSWRGLPRVYPTWLGSWGRGCKQNILAAATLVRRPEAVTSFLVSAMSLFGRR
jgi:hypothetical protein